MLLTKRVVYWLFIQRFLLNDLYFVSDSFYLSSMIEQRYKTLLLALK